MTDNKNSDPRRVHIGPVREDDSPKNVLHLPTEVIDTRSEPTMLFERSEAPHEVARTGERFRAAFSKCQAAISRNRPKVGREEKVEKDDNQPDVIGRHTFSSSSMRRRELQEKCVTIREVTITALTIILSIQLVIFVTWVQFLLYSWSQS